MAAPMDVVFSFDTTGSMSQVLDEVKCRLNDLIQRLQADIPQLKVGIIAHGDYCDKDHFYDIRTLDLTNNLPDVVSFVSETTGTGGGDIPECYELSMRHARDMSWREGSRRVFVVIGDAYPHQPDYAQNTLKIDWQEELSSLVKKSVTVYGVQYGEDPESVSFFQRITGQSGGQHLRLQNMGDICHVIMAICYRENDPNQLQNYEAEIRANNADTALKSGLENVFDKLGSSTMATAASNQLSKPSLALLSLLSSFSSVGSGDTAILRNNSIDEREGSGTIETHTSIDYSCPPTPINMDTEWLSDDESNEDGPFKPRKQVKRKHTCKESSVEEGCSPWKKARFVGHAIKYLPKVTYGIGHSKKLNKTKSNANEKQTRGPSVSALREKRKRVHFRSKRDAAGDNQFRFNNLPWSKWHLAAARHVPESSGVWKTVAQRGCTDALWRTDLLRYCEAKMNNIVSSNRGKELRSRTIAINACETTRTGVLFEIGLISPDSRSIKTMWLHATNQRKNRSAVPKMFSQPWYLGLTRSIKDPLTAAVKDGSKVYLRWAFVKDVQGVKREILQHYDYPWRSL